LGEKIFKCSTSGLSLKEEIYIGAIMQKNIDLIGGAATKFRI